MSRVVRCGCVVRRCRQRAELRVKSDHGRRLAEFWTRLVLPVFKDGKTLTRKQFDEAALAVSEYDREPGHVKYGETQHDAIQRNARHAEYVLSKQQA